MPADRARQTLVFLFALIQIVLPPILFAQGFDGGVGGRFDEPNPARPPGWAFSIWTPIYLLSLAHGIWQLSPSRRADPLLRRTGWLIALGFALSSAWLLAAYADAVAYTVPIILAMLLTLGRALVLACTHARTAGHRWFVCLPLGLFVGWLTAAVPLNIAEILPSPPAGPDPVSTGLVTVLTAASMAILFALRTRATAGLVLAALWALGTIVAANGGVGLDRPIGLVAFVAAVVLTIVALPFWSAQWRSARARAR